MISQRLRGVQEDGEALESGFMPKLQKAFGEVGISIEDENGELRSTYDILNDLAQVWDKLDSKQRQFLGEKAAGNRQVKTLNAIMANWDVVQDTIADAYGAQGTATEGNEKFMNSIEGRITAFQSAFQKLSKVTIESSFVKGVVDIGKTVTELATNAGGLVPILSTIAGIIVTIKGAQIAKGLSAIGTAFKGLTTGAAGAGAAFAGWIGIAIAAVGAIVMIKNVIDNSAESYEKLKSSAADSRKEYTESNSKIQSLNAELETTNTRIEELQGKGTLTIIEQDELDRLKETRAELETLIALENAKGGVAEAVSVRESADALDAFLTGTTGKNNKTRLKNLLEQSGMTEEFMQDVGVVSYGNIFGVGTETLASVEDTINTFKAKIPAYRQVVNDLIQERQKLVEELKTSGATDEQINENAGVKQLSLYIDTRQAELDSMLKYISNASSEMGELLTAPKIENPETDFEKRYNWLYDYVQGLNDFITEEYYLGQSKETQFTGYFSEKYKEEIEKLKATIESDGQISVDSIIKQFPEMVAEFEKFGWTPEDIAQYLLEMQQAIEDGTDIRKTGGVSYAANLVSNFYQSSEAYTKTLTAAIKEMNEAGVLTNETLAELLTLDEGLLEYMELTAEGYTMNTEAVYDYIEAMSDTDRTDALRGLTNANDKLKELERTSKEAYEAQYGLGTYDLDMSGLQAEVGYWQSIIFQIDSATDALVRFKAAQESPNEDQNYSEGKKAVEYVLDTYNPESEHFMQVGTDDYQTAMGYIFGDGWEQRFAGDLEAQYKKAQEIQKRYFGDDKLKSANNFMDDVVKGGFAEYDAEGGFHLMETDLESISEYLGISSEAARDMFGLIETYDPSQNFQFDYEVTPEDIKKMDLAQAQEELNGVNEKITETKKLLEGGEGDTNQLEQQLSGLEKEAELLQEHIDSGAELNVETMTLDDALTKIQELEAIIASGVELTFTLGGQYDELKNFVDNYEPEKPIDVPISTSGDGEESVDAVQTKVDTLNTNPANVKLNADDQATEKIGAVEQGTTQLNDTTGEATLSANSQNATENIQAVEKDVTDLNGETATATLNADGDAKETTQDVLGTANTIDTEKFTATVNAATGEGFETVQNEIDELTKDRTVKITPKYTERPVDETSDNYIDTTHKNEAGVTVGFSGELPYEKREPSKITETMDELHNSASKVNDDFEQISESSDVFVEAGDNAPETQAWIAQKEAEAGRVSVEADDVTIEPHSTSSIPTEGEIRNRASSIWNRQEEVHGTLDNSNVEELEVEELKVDSAESTGSTATESDNPWDAVTQQLVEDAEKAGKSVSFLSESADEVAEKTESSPWDSVTQQLIEETESAGHSVRVFSDDIGDASEEVTTPIASYGDEVGEAAYVIEGFADTTTDTQEDIVEGTKQFARDRKENDLSAALFMEELSDLSDGTETASESMGDFSVATDKSTGAVSENYETWQKSESDTFVPREDFTVSPLEPTSVEIDADTTNIPSEVEQAASSATPSATVQAETSQYVEDIESATPKNETVNVTANVQTNQTGGEVNYTSNVETPTVKDTSATVNYKADTSSATQALSSLTSAAKATVTKPVDLDTSKAVSANSTLETTLSRPVIKTVSIQTVGGVQQAAAKGTTNAIGGLSLVDEEGMELIEHRKQGTYELGTNKGARFTNLEKGDVVHTAKETKKILSRLASVGGFFSKGLNQAKSVIGGAFATGISGGINLNLINKIADKLRKANGGGGTGSSGSKSKKRGTTGSGKGSTGGDDKFKKWLEKLFDWIEIRLARLQKITDTWIFKAQQAIKYSTQNNYLNKAIKSIGKQIKQTSTAYDQYIKQANKIAKQAGLSSSIIKKIQSGALNINEYDTAMQEKIKAYQTWCYCHLVW